MTTILPLKIQKVNTNRSIYALYMYNTAYCLQMKTLDEIVTHRAEKLYDIWEIKQWLIFWVYIFCDHTGI